MAFITLPTGRLVDTTGAQTWEASYSEADHCVVETLYCTIDNEWLLRRIVTPQPLKPGAAPSVQWLPYNIELAKSWLERNT